MATTLLSGSTGNGTSRAWKDWTQKVKMGGGSWSRGSPVAEYFSRKEGWI